MVHFVCEKQQSQTLLTHDIKPNFDSRANDKRQQHFFSCKSTTKATQANPFASIEANRSFPQSQNKRNSFFI
jgi:hypothetical protein